MNRRSLTHSLLVFVFLLAQALVLVHEIGHELERPGERQHHSCSLCAVGHDLGAALPCSGQIVVACAPPSQMFGTFVIQVPDLALPLPRQRGPPLYS